MSAKIDEQETPAGSLPDTFRRLGLGSWLLRYYHQPINYFRWLFRQGHQGALQDAFGEAAMKKAAMRLTPVRVDDQNECFEASYMTGKNFWHQTAFCAHSLAGQLGGQLRPVFYDDGSLTTEQIDTLLRIFPNGSVVSAKESKRRLEEALPTAKFPLLHEVRDHVIMFRKLLDLRATTPGWQLYLDSDMLFFARPTFLETCARQRQACYMMDRVFGYCLPATEVERILGHPIPPNLNAGIVGLDNGLIDWERVESWLGRIPRAVRMHRLFEQTLTAMILSEFAPQPAPEDDYVILCDPYSSLPEDATLIHYIQNSKWTYLAREWRRYLAGRS